MSNAYMDNQNGLAPWTLDRTSGPVAKPLTLAQAKDHLNVAQSDTSNDNKINLFIDSAQERVEHDTSRVLITQQFDAIGNRFPLRDEAIPLNRNPVYAVTAITYLDEDAVRQSLSDAEYQFSKATRAVYPATGLSWPVALTTYGSIVVSFTAGYGPSGDDVPAELLSGMLLILDQLFYGIDNQAAYENVIQAYKRTEYP